MNIIRIVLCFGLIGILQCNTSKVNSKQKKVISGNKHLFEQLVKEKDGSKTNIEYINREGIIRTDVIVTNPITNVSVRDFNVRITQIDNSRFPEVTLLVSVTDKYGNPLIVSNKDYFQIEEHGLPVKKDNIIRIIQKKDINEKANKIPLNTVLAIDKSGSMNGGLTEEEKQPLWFAKRAAVDFINKVKDDDLVRVIAFDGDIHSLGSNKEAVSMIDLLKPKGSTALYGALFIGVKKLELGSGIKAMILLSDGRNDTRGTVSNTIKKITLQYGIHAAEQFAIPVFTIGFGQDFDEYTLRKIANDTHALFFKTANKEEINKLYTQIRQIITTQYLITYKSESLEAVTNVTARLGKYEDHRQFITPEHVIEREKKLIKEINIVAKEKFRLGKANEDINKQIANLNHRMKELDKKILILKEKEDLLSLTSNKINERESRLISYNKSIKELENKTNEDKIKLKQEKQYLDNIKSQLNENKIRLEERKEALAQREKDIDNKTNQLNNKENGLEQKLSKLDQKENKIKEEEARITQLKAMLESKEIELNSKLKKNEKIEVNLEKENKEIKLKQQKLNELKKLITSLLKQIKVEYEESIDDLVKQKKELDTIKP